MVVSLFLPALRAQGEPRSPVMLDSRLVPLCVDLSLFLFLCLTPTDLCLLCFRLSKKKEKTQFWRTGSECVLLEADDPEGAVCQTTRQCKHRLRRRQPNQ